MYLIEYYNSSCLLALSLRGNNLRTGKSLIIFLLNNKMDKVNSVEKIYLGNLKLRHFVTNKKNDLFEDENGNIVPVTQVSESSAQEDGEMEEIPSD